MQLTALLLLSSLVNLAVSGCSNRKSSSSSLILYPVGHVEKNAGLEISGLAKSRRYTDVYWAVNDSGNPATILPISSAGKVVSVSGQGIAVTGARNIDWESLAIDHSGKLYICDVGNNYSKRKVLQIYRISEPNLGSSASEKAEIIRVRYPDQQKNNSDKLLYDCEAAFVFKKKLYLLTKRLHDSATTLYRLDKKEKNTVNDLTLVRTYPIGGYVTAADISPDQKILAVLTYKSLWLFHDFPNDDFFNGRKQQITLKEAGQIESVVFTGSKELLLVNETKNEIFIVRLNIGDWHEKPVIPDLIRRPSFPE